MSTKRSQEDNGHAGEPETKKQKAVDINKIMDDFQPQISSVIEKFLPRKITHEYVEGLIGKPSYSNDPETLTRGLSEPIYEILDRGGKRWRSSLVLLIAEVFGKDHGIVRDFIPITELIHNGSLIVDDIEDKSEVRRGKPCLHLIYGGDVAINAGNAMYFWPLLILKQKKESMSPETLISGYEVCSEELLKLHFGQGMDIIWHNDKGEHDPTIEQYLQMCAYKTGTLARLSAKLSALVCGASAEQVYALGKFAETIGVAFQIQDDILNLVGEKFQESKGVGEDIHEGKRTLMVLHSFKNAAPADAKRLREILISHPPLDDQKTIKEAIAIIQSSKSIDFARAYAKQMVQDAWAGLDNIPDTFGAKNRLKAFADYLINRDI